MTTQELYWLAGWLEGEGSFCISHGKASNGKIYTRVNVQGQSTDHDVLIYIRQIAGGRVYGPYSGPGIGKKNVYFWSIGKQTDTLELLLKVEPLMISSRRKIQANLAITELKEKISKRVKI